MLYAYIFIAFCTSLSTLLVCRSRTNVASSARPTSICSCIIGLGFDEAQRCSCWSDCSCAVTLICEKSTPNVILNYSCSPSSIRTKRRRCFGRVSFQVGLLLNHTTTLAMPATSSMFMKRAIGHLFVFRLQVYIVMTGSRLSTPLFVPLQCRIIPGFIFGPAEQGHDAAWIA